MRKVLVWLMWAISLTGCSIMSGKPAPPEMLSYEQIISVEGQGADTLFVKANRWAVKTFNSAEAVIEYSDKDAGEIMGKYVFSFHDGLFTFKVRQVLSISVKESKVRIAFSNPFYSAKPVSLDGQPTIYGPYYPLTTLAGVERARKDWVSTVKSLEAALLSDNDSW